MKTCTKCQAVKPLDQFETIKAYKNRAERLSSHCKDCVRARRRQYWKETYYPAHTEEHKRNVVERRRQRKAEQNQEDTKETP